jgi:hypothetical protein
MMTTRSSYWQTTKHLIWFSLGMGCVLLSFIFWILQNRPQTVELLQTEHESHAADRPIQVEKVSINENLGTFSDEVSTLDVQQHNVDLTVHDAEFRGAKFVADNQKLWTLQLIKISDEDIIKAYLSNRADRRQFNYLRLQEAKKPDSYVLIYGQFSSAEQALAQAQTSNFALPSTVKITAVQLADYLPWVRDMGNEELLSASKLRQVILTKTAPPRQIIAPQIDAKSVAPASVENSILNQNINTGKPASSDAAKQQKMTIVGQKNHVEETNKDHKTKSSNNEGQINDPF